MRILIGLSVLAMTPALAQLEILPAQTGAGQPADASLGCDQLQTELTTVMANPAVQATLQQQAGLAGAAASAVTGSAQAVPTADPPAEEGKRKGGGLFKKFGQAAGGLGAALGGGRGAAAALGTAQAVGAAGALGGQAGGDVASAAQAAGALGNLGAFGGGGDKLASIGAVAQTTGALTGGRGGAGGLGNVAAAAGALQGGRGGLDAGALQALAAQQAQRTATARLPNAVTDTRASHLFELATAKKCAWVPTEAGAPQR